MSRFFNAIKSELKDLFSTKWKIASYILLLFVPLAYGGFFLSGFWAPIKNIDKLDIKIVNLDNDPSNLSQKMAEGLSKSPITIHSGSREYKMNLKLSNIYKTDGDVKKDVDKGKMDAAFTIPENYQENLKDKLVQNFPKLITNLMTDPNFINGMKDYKPPNEIPISILISFVSNIPELDLPKLDFFNSYKNNFLTGELTNLIASSNALSNTVINNIFQDISNPNSVVKDALKKAINDKLSIMIFPIGLTKVIVDTLIDELFNYFETHATSDHDELNNAISTFVDHRSIGGDIDSYGKGVSPYFFSISIWAGMLVAAFVLKNRRTRDQKKNNTFLNYFSKTLMWIGTSWIQITLLWLFVVFFWGQNSSYDASLFFSIYAYMLFLGVLFALIVQAIASFFRLAELGSLFIVILLIMQLISSSGTFPVEMQGWVFRALNHVVPFTYSIATFRELMFEPSLAHIFALQFPILVFLLLVPFSLWVNYRYDKKYFTKHNKYDSYVIEFDDE